MEVEEVHHPEVLVQEVEVDQEHDHQEVVEVAVRQALYYQEAEVVVGLLHASGEVVAVELLHASGEAVEVVFHTSEAEVEVEHPLVAVEAEVHQI